MEFNLSATRREGSGSGASHKLRAKGEVPAVLYGEKKPNENISVNSRELGLVMLRGGAGKLINLKLASGKTDTVEKVLLKDYQVHPMKGNIIHVDFLRVAMNHPVTVKVPVHLIYEEKRPRDGAILEVLLHELEVHCLPANIPDRINIDVSKLAIGSGIHVKDLTMPQGVKVTEGPEEAIVLAAAPTTATEAAPAETAEPEVISAKKEE